MPQSLARLHVHLIFGTKNRVPVLHNAVREPLHRYMAGVLQNFCCPPVLINSAADHVHILFDLGRTVAVSAAVEEVKKGFVKMDQNAGRGVCRVCVAGRVWGIRGFGIERRHGA